MTMIQLFNRLIIMDVSNWETNCHIKWQFWFGFCRFVVLYSIYCAYWRVQVRSYKYYTSKWHFQNIRWDKKQLLKTKLWLKNGWPSKPAFWSAFWLILLDDLKWLKEMKLKKSKCDGLTNRPTNQWSMDKARCSVACTQLKRDHLTLNMIMWDLISCW